MKYTNNDEKRYFPKEKNENKDYRTEWRRDFARIIHSSSFRRLQGKTQLFPGNESDFFRNRLTHSLEVAQIAKSITLKLNNDLRKSRKKYFIEPDIVEIAGLAHDIGHPPFGHFGEEVLDRGMVDYGGFEGNAQALRLLATVEKKTNPSSTRYGILDNGRDTRVGLNLTARCLASIIKYDQEIPRESTQRNHLLETGIIKKISPIKGYYQEEKAKVDFIKAAVVGKTKLTKGLKTIECQIMDLADDIAYSTYDLEDSFKAEFIKPIDIMSVNDNILDEVVRVINERLNINLNKGNIQEVIYEIFKDIFEVPYAIKGILKNPSKKFLQNLHNYGLRDANVSSNRFAQDGYYRTDLTSGLVNSFIQSIEINHIDKETPALSTIKINPKHLLEIEILKVLTYECQIQSHKLKIVAYRCKDIIEFIFNTLMAEKGFQLLPSDFKSIYEKIDSNKRPRIICDFIAGMTDRYVLEFYGRLTSENPQTIFKPC
ncbi:MAG: dNTP triphosphohydrolase [Candidatus Omnitrophica bacterium]|nr:dNTP triphosphohydrolase [Candidatus Omnitrophota bacterium]